MSQSGLSIDSGVSGLSFAEEDTLKTLPGSPIWYRLEPNSYSDFGPSNELLVRRPLSTSRQNVKGVITSTSSAGGFQNDLTQNNLKRLMQGFFFADHREKPDTDPMARFNSPPSAVTITSVSTTDDSFNASGGDFTATGNAFVSGHIIIGTGFTNQALNNNPFVVDTVAATKITVVENLVDEASPPTGPPPAAIRVVGYQAASGDLDFNATGSVPNQTELWLSSTTLDFTTLGLTVGEWIFIGGDSASTQFANNQGYARISGIAANKLNFDEVTWATPVTEAGTGDTIQIFFGKFLKNEATASEIVCRTYHLERTLGEDSNGEQAEYLQGAVANELTITVGTQDKITMDLSFVGTEFTTRDGATGLISAGDDSVAPPVENAFNTSVDAYRMRMYVIDSNNLNPTSFFAYISEMTMSINNNAQALPAIGFVGGFDVGTGNFDVSGTAEVYFSEVAALQAIRDNSDVGMNMILAKDNAGMVWDIPLLAIGGGQPTLELDESIKLPLETSGARNANDYTLSSTWFDYLPDLGMPS